MLSTTEIDHYGIFGFVVLRGLLGWEGTTRLRAEVDAAIRDAYADSYDERVLDGISGHYLPMASRLTLTSASLICDDSVFIDAAGRCSTVRSSPSVPKGCCTSPTWAGTTTMGSA